MSSNSSKIGDNTKVPATLYGFNKNTFRQETLDARLIFLKKGSDAKLDIVVEDENTELPSWVEPGSAVNMKVIWPSKGVLSFSGRISYVINNRVHVGNLIYKQTIQRRRDVKIGFTKPGLLYIDEIEGLEPLDIKFQNISAGGAGFKLEATDEARLLVLCGSGYRLVFGMGEEKRAELRLRIVRVNEKEEDDGKLWLYCGSAFENLKPGVEMNLRQLVFQYQKEENLRERELKLQQNIFIDTFLKDGEKEG